MGGLGSDAAIEAADIVIMDDRIEKVPLAVRIARRTVRIAWQNIIFALAVKLATLLLGALGYAEMCNASGKMTAGVLCGQLKKELKIKEH